MANLEELRHDLEEYEQFHKTAKRLKVQEVLSKEIGRLQREVVALETKIAAKSAEAAGNQDSSNWSESGEKIHSYIENITNYGFDQNKNFMEVYLPLDKLSDISNDKIVADFSNRSFTVKVHFPNKTSQLHIAKLCEEIVPKESFCKKKSKHVIVMLKKAEVGKTWTSLSEREKKAKEKKDKPKFDKNEDPGASLTRLLKDMYDEGDDEMKRTISKAWYDSQMKKDKGGLPDFSEL